MAIKKYKVQDGIFTFERTHANGPDLEPFLKESFVKIGKVEPLMAKWESFAKTILEKNGYPSAWADLSRKLLDGTTHKAQIHNIEQMLFAFREVRNAVKINKCEQAAYYMAQAIEAGMKAQIRPIEPFVEKGVRHSETQSKKAQKPRTRGGLTPEQRKERNQKIIADYRDAMAQPGNMTLTGFVKKYGKKHNLKPTQLTKIIKSYINT